jgi:hypothetical protein
VAEVFILLSRWPFPGAFDHLEHGVNQKGVQSATQNGEHQKIADVRRKKMS